MRIKGLKTYCLKPREIIRDRKEGGRREAFSREGVEIQAFIYDENHTLLPASGGIRYVSEKVMLFAPPELSCSCDTAGQERYLYRDGDEMSAICAGDGVCVYMPPDAEPDYRITSIVWQGHLVCKLERI